MVLGHDARSGGHPPALAAEDRADGLGFATGLILSLPLSAGLWGLIGLGAWHLLG